METLLYCVVCFRVWSTTKEVFVIDVMDATLGNWRVFTQQHAQDAKVSLARYKKANGNPSPSNINTNNP
jgi:hypothetical protein